MKSLFILTFICFLFFSCDKKIQEKESPISMDDIFIPFVEKNKHDAKFKTKNGVLFFDDKVYSGYVNEYHKEDILKSTSQYYKGKREGKYFGWYPNKSKWFQRFYKNGIKLGTHKGWFKDGQQMFEYQLNDKGVYNGSVKDWHYNGQIAKHFNFVNGKEEGSQKMWKVNGNIRANFYTVNGERHGLIGLKNCVSVLTTTDNN